MTDWLVITLAAIFCAFFAVVAFGIAMTLAMFLAPGGREQHQDAPRSPEVGTADLPPALGNGFSGRVRTGLPEPEPMSPEAQGAPSGAQDGFRRTRRTGKGCTPCQRVRAFLGL